MSWKLGETLILKKDVLAYHTKNGVKSLRSAKTGEEVVLIWIPPHTYKPVYIEPRRLVGSYVGVVLKEEFVKKSDEWNAKKRKSNRWIWRLFEGLMATIPQKALTREAVIKEGLKGLS